MNTCNVETKHRYRISLRLRNVRAQRNKTISWMCVQNWLNLQSAAVAASNPDTMHALELIIPSNVKRSYKHLDGSMLADSYAIHMNQYNCEDYED